jgi:hypothetical protein
MATLRKPRLSAEVIGMGLGLVVSLAVVAGFFWVFGR